MNEHKADDDDEYDVHYLYNVEHHEVEEEELDQPFLDISHVA